MSLSVKGLTNMNYTISNAALFSDAYTKSVKQIKSAGQFYYWYNRIEMVKKANN